MSSAFTQALRGQTLLAATVRLERERASPSEADRRFPQTIKEEAARLRVPLMSFSP